MPELPEVERIRLTLELALVGARVVAVRLHRADVVMGAGLIDPSEPSHPRRRCAMPRLGGGRISMRKRLLEGGVISRLVRHGKQLAIVADDGRALCVQLGMSGQLFMVNGPQGTQHPRRRFALPRRDHVHCEWEIERDETRLWLVFRDPRRFGRLRPYASEEELRRSRWDHLGPDALDARGAALWKAVRSSRRAIKAALLDQRVVAGVGNIYADEALFRARINPSCLGVELSSAATTRLARAIRTVTKQAIAAGGTTLRDYVDGNGATGRFLRLLKVYGRAEQPCRACGHTLERIVLAQRSTVFCPECQLLP